MSRAGHLHQWEGRSTEEWRARWQLPALIALRETGSTNDITRRMAEQGAPAGLLVMTEHQTAGRGRMSRSWADTSGQSLLLSFLLRPRSGELHSSARPAPGRAAGGIPASPAHALAPGTAPLRVGLAIATALRSCAGVDALIKWPNDIMIDGRKVAGILCEAVSTGGETVIVAGIGINVLQAAGEWPAELHDTAISVAEAMSAAAPDRGAIMDALVDAIRPLFTLPLAPLDGREVRAFAALDALHGCALTVSPPGADATSVQGIAAGIAPDGALLIDTGGKVQRVTSGSVRTAATRTPHSARG